MSGDQPAPHGRGPEIAAFVKQDIDARVEKGIATYGEPLRAFNGRSAMQDLYEELLDAAMYVRQEIEERARAAAARTIFHFGEHLELAVYQRDWMPGFAGFVHKPKLGDPLDGAHIVLNIGAFMGCVANKDIAPSELPYFIAESIMHEVIHALEAWARVEFSEDRVEALIARYREYHAALEAEHGHAASGARDADGDPD